MVLSMLAAVTAYAGRPAEPATFRADHFDVAEMIREADQTGDGKLNFEEFKKAIVTARKVYLPDLVDDHECACKVQSAFDFVDVALDEELDVFELTRLLEAGQRMAAAANSAVQAKLAQGNYTNGAGNRRKLQLPYENQWSSTIQQWMKGVYTLKPDPYSYIPKAENKMSPPPPPGGALYGNWPLLKPRWEGQTREERWWEVWGLANGGRRVDADGNRVNPGKGLESRGKVRGCEADVVAETTTASAASDTPVCFNLKGDEWCAAKASECTSELYVYTNCMALCSLDC